MGPTNSPDIGGAHRGDWVPPTGSVAPINRVPGPHEPYTSSYDTVPRQAAVPPASLIHTPTNGAVHNANGWRIATVALGVTLVFALVGVALALKGRGDDAAVTAAPQTGIARLVSEPASIAPTTDGGSAAGSVAPTAPTTTAPGTASGGGAPVVTIQQVTTPSAPTITSWADAGAGKVLLKVQPPSNWGNGAGGTRTLEYRASTGFGLPGTWKVLPADGVIGLAGSCQNYSVSVRATNERYSSVPSTATTVTVYAPPPAPLLKATVIGATISWGQEVMMSIPEAPHACPFTVTVKIDGVAAAFGTYTYGYSQTHTLVATATDSGGRSASSSIQATTDPAPPPAASVSIARGAFNTTSTPMCAVGACKWVNISSSGWSAGQALTITCYSTTGSSGPITRYADGSGKLNANDLCAYSTNFSVYVVINGVKSNTVTPWKDW